jgi:phage shock protein A
MSFALIQEFLFEARKKTKQYTEKFDKKIASQLVEVSVEIKAGTIEGREWSELAENYLALQKQQEDIAVTLGAQNDDLRERVEKLFDASDEVATRIVKVGDIVINVAKLAKTNPKQEVDYEGILAAISAVSEEMSAKVEELKKQMTTTKPAPAPKKPALRVSDNTTGTNAKLKEDISSVVDSISKFINKFTSWIKGVDKKIEKIESMIV